MPFRPKSTLVISPSTSGETFGRRYPSLRRERPLSNVRHHHSRTAQLHLRCLQELPIARMTATTAIPGTAMAPLLCPLNHQCRIEGRSEEAVILLKYLVPSTELVKIYELATQRLGWAVPIGLLIAAREECTKNSPGAS